jgi:hypothetical protein
LINITIAEGVEVKQWGERENMRGGCTLKRSKERKNKNKVDFKMPGRSL